MGETNDVVWLVGRADEPGEVQERFGDLDATVQETWPGGPGVVALVRAAGSAADRAATLLGGEVERYDEEEAAIHAAAALAAS